MSSPAATDAKRGSSASAAVFVATFAGLVLLIVVLLFVDMALAAVDRRESTLHATQLYSEGNALLAQNKAHEAADRFSSAVAMDRENTSYALGLAHAVLADGKQVEAERMLRVLLHRTENDGAVNLELARVLSAEGRTAEARAYYHRAIFGRWGADSLMRRTEARFELADNLAKANAEPELLAELLPLEAQFPESVAISRRLGHLFVAAGSPRHASDMFRKLLKANPRDADAFAGIGEASLVTGNFSRAHAEFVEAARLDPGNARIAERRAVTDSVLDIYPFIRGLSSHDRYVRSRALLSRTVLSVQRCGGVGAVSDAMADSVRAALTGKIGSLTEELAAERVTRTAQDVWSGRAAHCTADFVEDQPLAIVHAALAQ